MEPLSAEAAKITAENFDKNVLSGRNPTLQLCSEVHAHSSQSLARREENCQRHTAWFLSLGTGVPSRGRDGQ